MAKMLKDGSAQLQKLRRSNAEQAQEADLQEIGGDSSYPYDTMVLRPNIIVRHDSLWRKPLQCAAILLASLLAYWLSGGFPPWAWRFLFQTTPQVSTLWQERGGAILFPFIGLILLSLVLLLIWATLVIMGIRVAWTWWNEVRVSEEKRLEGIEEVEEVEEVGDITDEPTVPLSSGLVMSASTERLRFVVGIGTDPGVMRKGKPNEDTVLAIQGMCATGGESQDFAQGEMQPAGLFVVADGMGGHACGEEASRLAIQTLSDVVVPALLRNTEDVEMLIELLKDGVHRANLAIYKRNRSQEEMMGTTLTAALIIGATAYVCNVGDSRTYIYRQPQERGKPEKHGEQKKQSALLQVTRDHSHVARLVELGEIKRDDMYVHPLRNQIYRCLGDHSSVQIDSYTVPLQVGDMLLLCSDGLWEMVRDAEIECILRETYPHASQASNRLVQAALNNGGEDNVSVILVGVSYVGA